MFGSSGNGIACEGGWGVEPVIAGSAGGWRLEAGARVKRSLDDLSELLHVLVREERISRKVRKARKGLDQGAQQLLPRRALRALRESS